MGRPMKILSENALDMVVVAVIGGVGVLALTEINNSGSFTGAALGVINNGTDGIVKLFAFLGTQGTLLAIVVLVSIVLLIRGVAKSKGRE